MNILDLSNIEAKEWLLKSSSYVNFDIPKYFDFSNIIGACEHHLEGRNISDFYNASIKPWNCENVNYLFLNNKSGAYDWRPFQILHPALYVSLVSIITEESNWRLLLNNFSSISETSFVDCCSIPAISESEESDRAEQILTWWSALEQKSIELAMDFDFLYETDITDCYGAIYTHSIPWAIHGKEFMK